MKRFLLWCTNFLPDSFRPSAVNFLEHRGLKRYSFNTSWMFASQVINLLVAFFIGAWVARYLGPLRFGLINYAVSFAGLFAFLLGFGIDAILNRELIKTPEKKNELISNSLWIKFIGGIVAVLVANMTAYFLKNDSTSRLLIFLFSLTFLLQMFSVLNTYFQSRVLAKINFQAQVIGMSVTTIAKIVGIYFHFEVVWFICIYLIDALIGAGVMWAFYKQQGNSIKWTIDKKVIKDLLRDSWPLMLSTVAATIYLDIDQIIIKFMLSSASVGVYSIAVKLSEIWYFVPSIICASLFPAIVNAKKVGEQGYMVRLSRLYWLMIILAIIVVVPMFFLSGFIVPLLFGKAYSGAIAPLRFYIWSDIPQFLMVAVSQYLITENYSKVFFISTVSGAVANILLNIILIPKLGITGSALATLISYSIPLLVCASYSKTRKQFISALLLPFAKA